MICGTEKRLREKGSALTIVLIAVALFAALSFTVSQMLREGNPESIGRETNKLFASETLNYARAMRQAVQNLKISNGCSDEDISFTREAGDSYEHSPPAPDRCKVFHPDGGGMVYSAVDQKISSLEWEFEGAILVHGLGSDTAPDGTELVLYLAGISEGLCEEINESLGHGFSSIPVDNGNIIENTPDPFDGNYINSAEADELIGDPAAADCSTMRPLCGKIAGCFREEEGSEYYIFYQVLITR